MTTNNEQNKDTRKDTKQNDSYNPKHPEYQDNNQNPKKSYTPGDSEEENKTIRAHDNSIHQKEALSKYANKEEDEAEHGNGKTSHGKYSGYEFESEECGKDGRRTNKAQYNQSDNKTNYMKTKNQSDQ